ncbi:cupredoxin domain-containing protein [Patescibacteria group bacterium]|nr:cupredoxin domain-containing protein [Patescibacteria group bacterium]MBU1705613.1 cupredoxin domain-containing protein [Patescibacteria group bacterium]
MKKLIALLSIFAFVVLAMPVSAATPLAQINSGDLIRGTTFNAVYYMGEDGMRYVFPNDKAYFTWYNNFDTVKWLTDADLAKVQIGGNVTYRPGVRMVKINSDPKTYAVGAGGSLEWVTSEAVAVALYGSNWNQKIDDVPDAFFGNYKKGSEINTAGDFDPASETANASDINEDKNLQEPIVVTISNSTYSPSSLTIAKGRAVKFVNNSSGKHTATAEDLSWGTGTLNNGEAFIRYFKTVGEFGYFDSYNPSSIMGAITVN